jgi:phage terminase large subunit
LGNTERLITLPYSPRRVFLPYHERAQRWAVLVAHRRCGKTVSCINDVIKRAVTLDREHGRFAYVAPYLSQAKEVAWEYLKRFAQPITADKNEAELWIELITGARIRIHGADNPDRLRGAYLDGVVLDEYADMRPSVWGEVIRPMLADRQGWATFIGTPKGRNEFFQVWDQAQSNPNWFAGMLRASETGLLPKAELEDAARDMTPEQYDQEFECSFDAAILGAYFGKEIAEAERAGRITNVPYDPALPVYTAWDLGVGDSTAIWFFQVDRDSIRVIDHYENHNQGLPHYASVLAARGFDYATDWVPHDARVKELGTGRTRIETLQELGRKPDVVPSHKVMDGINAARLTLRKCWFDKMRCADGIEALRQYRAEFDEKTRAFKDNPRHDWASHTADAFRYLAMAWREMAGEPLPPAPMRVLNVGFAGGARFDDIVSPLGEIRPREDRV